MPPMKKQAPYHSPTGKILATPHFQICHITFENQNFKRLDTMTHNTLKGISYGGGGGGGGVIVINE